MRKTISQRQQVAQGREAAIRSAEGERSQRSDLLTPRAGGEIEKG